MNEPLRPPPPERDPALDAAWRAHSTELPPPSVDAAILAAAHREVASHPRAAGDDDTLAEAREPSRWWWGLAAAATIGAIAFGVVQLAPFGTAHDPTRATDMPSAERTARPADVLAPMIAEETARTKPQGASTAPTGYARTEAPAHEEAEATRAPESAPAAVKAKPAPALPPAGTRQRTEAPALASTERDLAPPAETPRPFPMAAAPAPAAPPASSPTAKQEGAAAVASASVAERAAEVLAKRASPAADAAPAAAGASAEGRVAALRTPESYVVRIRELHEAGRLDEAARELVAFRNAYPDADAKLPPSLRAWAATIQK